MAFRIFKPKKYHIGMTGEELTNVLSDAEKNNVVLLNDDFVNVSVTETQAATLLSVGKLENVNIVGLTAGNVFPDSLLIRIEGLGIIKCRFADFRTRVRYDAFAFDPYDRFCYLYLAVNPASPDTCTIWMNLFNA